MSIDQDELDDTNDDTTTNHSMPDPFVLAIELCRIAVNAKAIEPALKRLRKLGHDIEKAERKLAAVQAQAEQTNVELAAREAAIDERERALDARAAEIESSLTDARDDLAQREQNITRLESTWRNLGEPQDVMSGFRSPEFSPLQKARMAHGRQPGKDLDPLLSSEPDGVPAAAIDALIRRDVGDERSDAQGNVFAPSTLTRSTEHKRGIV
jgi:hypothetical protein